MMRSFSIYALFLFALFFNMTGPLRAQDAEEYWVLTIRKQVAAVNAPGTKYRVEEDDSTFESSEGAEIKKYYAGKVLCKVTLDEFGAMGNSQAEYYFSGDKLIFCYEVTKLYGGPMEDKNRPLISEEHNRYYLHDGKLFRFINKKGRKIEGKALQEKQKELDKLKEALKL